MTRLKKQYQDAREELHVVRVHHDTLPPCKKYINVFCYCPFVMPYGWFNPLTGACFVKKGYGAGAQGQQ